MAYTKQTHCKKGHLYTEASVYVGHRADGRTFRQCRECTNVSNRASYQGLTLEERRARRKRFPSQAKMARYGQKHRFATRYGITVEAAKDLLIAQDGLCAMCYGTEPATHLDHDHETGKVRGWLCGNCNRALGLLADDPERLLNAVAYLEGVA